MHTPPITYRVKPDVSNDALNALFFTAWEGYYDYDFAPVLSRSLTYVCAYDGDTLVGYVNVAWDGDLHGFLLDTTVHHNWQRRGIGRELVQRAAAADAQARGILWLHVDYEPHLDTFYKSCGFRPTLAGLIRLA